MLCLGFVGWDLLTGVKLLLCLLNQVAGLIAATCCRDWCEDCVMFQWLSVLSFCVIVGRFYSDAVVEYSQNC